MSPYSLSEALESLADVNWFSVVIVEGVNAILIIANLLVVFVFRVKEFSDLATDCRYIFRQTNSSGLNAAWLLYR